MYGTRGPYYVGSGEHTRPAIPGAELLEGWPSARKAV